MRRMIRAVLSAVVLCCMLRPDVSFAHAPIRAVKNIVLVHGTAAKDFTSTISVAAWRTRPSWMLVPTADMFINPELERWYAVRAHSTVTEVRGASHSVYESQPARVAAFIERAAIRGR